MFFNQPELEAKVSVSEQNCPLSVFVSVIIGVNVLHLYLLFQNYWADFNQHLLKSSKGEGDFSLLKKGQIIFELEII